jgi:thiol-disulfide isomerase/thioredoxin
MKYSLSLALVLLSLATSAGLAGQQQRAATPRLHTAASAPASTRGQAMLAAALDLKRRATATQAHRANSVQAEAPVIREINLETLKNLLQRSGVGGPEAARPLLINFWATWCEPCREEFPDLVRINADYGKSNLDFITISLDEPEDSKTKVPKFLREMHAQMPAYLLNVIDPQTVIDMIDPQWHGGLPATFLYDASGKRVFRRTGRVDIKELCAALDKVTTGK